MYKKEITTFIDIEKDRLEVDSIEVAYNDFVVGDDVINFSIRYSYITISNIIFTFYYIKYLDSVHYLQENIFSISEDNRYSFSVNSNKNLVIRIL